MDQATVPMKNIWAWTYWAIEMQNKSVLPTASGQRYTVKRIWHTQLSLTEGFSYFIDAIEGNSF